MFPRKKKQTTVEKHKAETNKGKSAKSERRIRSKKREMIRKCRNIMTQCGLVFDPVVINSRSAAVEKSKPVAVRKASADKAAKQVKTRPLMQEKVESVPVTGPAPVAKKQTSNKGLKIMTLVPSATSIGKRKLRSHS